MRNRGFTSHAAMGATLLGGVWLAVYLPDLLSILRQGGTLFWVGLAILLAGAIGGPAMLILIEGDEFFGVLGILSALLFSWAGGYLAAWAGAAADSLNLLRLSSAAFGPVLLYVTFFLIGVYRNWRQNAGSANE